MKFILFIRFKSLVFILLLVSTQSVNAQPIPCPCDPFDIDCLDSHPACQDENSVPVNGNIGFLALAVMCFGIYKIVNVSVYLKENKPTFLRLGYVKYYQLKKQFLL